MYMDFDSHKNQEWLRRRKLRLEQVRKQSNEIARVLREKVNEEEKRRLEEYERVREEKFQIWKAQRLEELERKLKCALEGFGSGYLLAQEEPNQNLILEEKKKINFSEAQRRGEIAHQEELKRKKQAKEKNVCAIERKKMTRKKEDLRSALVRSIPVKKKLIQVQEVSEDDCQLPKQKVTLLKKKIKKHIVKSNFPVNDKKRAPVKSSKLKKMNHRLCGCENRVTEFEICPAKKGDTVWINLNEIRSSEGCAASSLRTSKSALESDEKKSQTERGEAAVEFYDFSSRYYCKSFKELPHLVEKIDHDSIQLNAHELAEIEEEENRVETKKKAEMDALSHSRGLEALRKERINRNYNNLMTKLDELCKKEKILKTQTRNPLSFFHMNDERLSERAKARQRAMESKFESIYFEATAGIPQPGLSCLKPLANLSGGGDYFEPDDRLTTKLPSNLQHNSPESSSGRSSAPTLTPFEQRETDKANGEEWLLRNINRTLKEGRELRKITERKRRSESSERESEEEEEAAEEEEEEDEEEVEEEEDGEEVKEEKAKVGNDGGEKVSLGGSARTLTKNQESQTEEANVTGGKEESLFKGGDDSLPVSTSTSYKSPPSVIRCRRLNQFLDYLEGLSETEEQKSSEMRRKVSKVLEELMHEESVNKSERKDRESRLDPTLAYYIDKLLDMSRECIANLSVSSETVSTLNTTDLDSEHMSGPTFLAEDLVRKSRLERADVLEKSIRNWKAILGKYSPPKSLSDEKLPVAEKSNRILEAEDIVDSPSVNRIELMKEKSEGPLTVACSREVGSKYDVITKKCSERILELSDLLDKVRKDKKLLVSGSGDSSACLDRDQGFDTETVKALPFRKRCGAPQQKTSPVLEGFINRYNLMRPREETVSTTAVADSQSLQDANESLESWPDVMDELLKREILTSPFKWSAGDTSSELSALDESHPKPSTIESVIGNFRKEIDKIKKPFVLARESTFSQLSRDIPDHIGSRDRRTSIDEDQDLLLSPRRRSDSLQEESSVESINHYLTSLGLNWAKSFLRKDAKSRAMSSSSNSDRKSVGDEEE